MKKKNDRFDREVVRSCKTCAHYDQPLTNVAGIVVGDCRTRYAGWYPQRGYAPCPHYHELSLTDDDYL